VGGGDLRIDVGWGESEVNKMRNWKNHIFGLCPSCNVSKPQRFGNWICFRLQLKMMGTRTLLGPLERDPTE
jgi:hypothetical protein